MKLTKEHVGLFGSVVGSACALGAAVALIGSAGKILGQAIEVAPTWGQLALQGFVLLFAAAVMFFTFVLGIGAADEYLEAIRGEKK